MHDVCSPVARTADLPVEFGSGPGGPTAVGSSKAAGRTEHPGDLERDSTLGDARERSLATLGEKLVDQLGRLRKSGMVGSSGKS